MPVRTKEAKRLTPKYTQRDASRGRQRKERSHKTGTETSQRKKWHSSSGNEVLKLRALGDDRHPSWHCPTRNLELSAGDTGNAMGAAPAERGNRPEFAPDGQG